MQDPLSTDTLMTRRDLVSAGAAAGIVIGVAACGGGGKSSQKAQTPKRGGTLVAALTGGGSTDTLDAHAPVTNMDVARNFALYNSFVVLDTNVRPTLSLADEISPNKNATKWVIRLKKGILFHNGKEATADDVIFTFQRITNPKLALPGAGTIPYVNAAGIKKLDRYTVEIPMHSPFSSFEAAIYCNSFDFTLVPVGYDPKHPIGTGPFKYESFTPGTTSTFVRNDHYFVSGRPYIDKLVINDFSDVTSQINALSSGQAHVVNLLSSESIATVKSAGAEVVISDSGGINPFTMRVNAPPFDDARVRQAFRLIVDRPQMLQIVFAGHGTIANDLTSPYDPLFNHSLPQRHQDIEQAKSLLKQAGHEHGTFTLVTADIAQGIIPAAQVFAQQASKAGITVNVSQKPVSVFYGPNYKQWQFAQDYLFYYTYLTQVAESFLPTAPFNETHWPDKEDAQHYQALFNEANSTTEVNKQREIVHEMQSIEWDRGSYIIPHYPPIIDGHSAKVHGIVPTKSGLDLSNYAWDKFWME